MAKKILFITDNFPPEVNAPATRTFEHCREWVKRGAEITVITCFPNFPQGKVYEGYKNKLKQTETIEGIKVIRVWTYITANEGFVRRTIDYISFSVSAFFAGLFLKTDVIIATSPQFFTALCGRTLSFWKGKPWIMEVRDLWPESIKTVGAMKNSLFIRYFEWQEKRCYRSAKKIITVTDSFKTRIIERGISDAKIDVVKNGANLELYKPKDRNLELLRDLKLQGKLILSYIGTIGMAHKIDFILDCAKEISKSNPRFHFIIMGAGAEKNNITDKIKNDQIDNVTLLDPVQKSMVVEFLSITDAAIINLRKSELFKTVIPSKIFESAAMQVPILIGVDGESRFIVEKYNAGLFYEPENISDFIGKASFLFSNDNLYCKCKEGGAKLAIDFDRKKLANEMFDIIKEV